MNGQHFPEVLNPYAALLNSAHEVRNALGESVTNLELALENEAAKRRTAKELRSMYDEAEAEFLAEAVFAADAKNAEGRKAQVDAALVKARQSGKLARLWAQANAAAYDADDAKVGLEQAAKRFRATEAAADLTAAMLRAATA